MPRSTYFQNRNNKIYVCLCVSFFFFFKQIAKKHIFLLAELGRNLSFWISCWDFGSCRYGYTLQKAKGTTLQLDWAVAGLDSSQEQMGLIYKHMHVCLCECVCASKKSQPGHCHSFPTMLQAYIRRNLIKSINCSGGMLRCNIWWSGYRKHMKTT